MQSYDEILAELTQQASTFTPAQLNAAIATAAQGRMNADEIAIYTKNVLADKSLVWLQSDSPITAAGMVRKSVSALAR